MKKFLTVLLTLIIIVMVVIPAALAAKSDDYEFEGDVYNVSSDTEVTGLPMPAPEPPHPVAPEPPVTMPPSGVPRPEPTPEPTPPEEEEYYPMPDAVWLPRPEPTPIPEPSPIIVAVERVLPCPPEPPVMPDEPTLPEPTPPAWEPEPEDEEIFVAALPPWDTTRGCIIYCTLDVDTITILVESFEEISPKLLVFDVISCRTEVVEPTAGRRFEIERPRGTRLYLAVFDDEGVFYDVTVWTPPLSAS